MWAKGFLLLSHWAQPGSHDWAVKISEHPPEMRQGFFYVPTSKLKRCHPARPPDGNGTLRPAQGRPGGPALHPPQRMGFLFRKAAQTCTRDGLTAPISRHFHPPCPEVTAEPANPATRLARHHANETVSTSGSPRPTQPISVSGPQASDCETGFFRPTLFAGRRTQQRTLPWIAMPADAGLPGRIPATRAGLTVVCPEHARFRPHPAAPCPRKPAA